MGKSYKDYYNGVVRILGPKFINDLIGDFGFEPEHIESFLDDTFLDVSDYLTAERSVLITWDDSSQHNQEITAELIAADWDFGTSNIKAIEYVTSSRFSVLPFLNENEYNIRILNEKISIDFLRIRPPKNSEFIVYFEVPWKTNRDEFNLPDKYFEGVINIVAAKVGYTIAAFYANKDSTKLGIDNIDFTDKSRSWRLLSDTWLKFGYRLLNIPETGIGASGIVVSMRTRR